MSELYVMIHTKFDYPTQILEYMILYYNNFLISHWARQWYNVLSYTMEQSAVAGYYGTCK